MRGRIPQDVLDRVLAAHDVAEVVGRYVPLKKAGRAWKALCPFHEEKTPSFTVNPDRQTFKCFGCGKGGNVFGFLMEHEGLTFPEAVRALAAERGIAVPDGGGRAGGGRRRARRGRPRGARARAGALRRSTLASPEGAATRAYLEQRGFPRRGRPRRSASASRPPGWDRLLQAAAAQARSPPRCSRTAGLVVRARQGHGHYDRFRNRVTFPDRRPRRGASSRSARARSPRTTRRST